MGTIADKVKSLFNNPEKEKKKLEDEEKKINERIKTEIERSEIAQKRADIERKNDAIDDMNFKKKVYEADIRLGLLEKEFITRLTSDINAVKKREEQNLPIDEQKTRMKNSYYTLITIRRLQERLVQVKDERQWNLAMRDKSETIKIINEISSGSTFLQNIIFKYRYGKMVAKEKLAKKNMNNQYGASIDSIVSDEEIDRIKNGNLIDMLVTDELYKRLLDDSSISNIKNCLDKNDGVTVQPDKIEEISSEEKDADSSSTSNGKGKKMDEETFEDIINDMKNI